MNRLLFVSLFLIIAQFSQAQTDRLSWFSDLQEARTAVAEDGREILMVFAGSDWCRPCIQFKQDILHAPEFDDQMKNKLVVLYLDFPARKKNKLPAEQTAKNEALAEKYNKSGAFPKIILLDKNEKILVNVDFVGQTPGKFMEELSAFLTAQH